MGKDSSSHDKTKVNGEDAGFEFSMTALSMPRALFQKYNLSYSPSHSYRFGSDPEAWAEAAKVSSSF